MPAEVTATPSADLPEVPLRELRRFAQMRRELPGNPSLPTLSRWAARGDLPFIILGGVRYSHASWVVARGVANTIVPAPQSDGRAAPTTTTRRRRQEVTTAVETLKARGIFR